MFAVACFHRITNHVPKTKCPLFKVKCTFKQNIHISKHKVPFYGVLRANITAERSLRSWCLDRSKASFQLSCLTGPLPYRHHSKARPNDHITRCHFHTTRPTAALPPLLALVVAPLSKVAAALTGRSIRKWLNEQPPHLKKEYYRYIASAFLAVLVLMGAVALYYYESHIQEAPVTGRKRFITLDKEQSCKIAEYELESLLEEYQDKTLPATHPYYQAVVNTGLKLVRANKDIPGMADQKWVVHVIKNQEKNAFVLPNGHIFVFTGMLEFCQNQDQLAIILGHEMAHAVLLHSAEQISHTQFLDKIIIVLMTALWTFMPSDGIAVVFQWYCNKLKKFHLDMPYSRDLEKEADRVGLQLAAKACFDVREGSVLWSRMSISEDINGTEKQPEWLSTHPTHENRVITINQLIPKNLAIREKCDCPKLPEADPRLKAQELRNEMNNVMIAKAAKLNLHRVEKVSS